MFAGLVLVHRSKAVKSKITPSSEGGSAGAGFPVTERAFVFETCLRSIAVVDQEEYEAKWASVVDPNDQILWEEEAYRFLLQVICGLHSPLIGETEVYGQFKIAVGNFVVPLGHWGRTYHRFFKTLFEDAKRVRQAHLEDLGSQSYGSVLRRELRGARCLHILGAGHLVQEILPWLAKDGIEIHLHVRDANKVSTTLGRFVKVHALTETASGLATADALIIAAPVPAQVVARWAASAKQDVVVADLRADSRQDRLSGFDRVVDLHDVFDRISENRTVLEAKKAAALSFIDTIVTERNSHVEYRPFGWEDVCA